jgi:hypothetical protein
LSASIDELVVIGVSTRVGVLTCDDDGVVPSKLLPGLGKDSSKLSHAAYSTANDDKVGDGMGRDTTSGIAMMRGEREGAILDIA